MTVTAHDFAVRLGLPANDTAAARAVEAALAWARDVFALADDAELDLNATQEQAVAGYARDVLKLPKATFGYFADDREGVPAAMGNLDRRWRPMLIGTRARGFA